MNPRDRLQYALYLQRLHELFVIKENIAFQYPNAHYNKAAEQIDKVVDKCLDNNIKAAVDGTHNLESPNLDHVISGALSSQQKMLVKTDDKYIQSAVEGNTKEFTRFIQNRIEKENYSLQAKIEKEYQKKKYQDMSEEQAKKLIRQKFQDSARKRAKNIVKDALHTNQSQISWTYNVNNGMKYKVWMNGQGKSKVRDWHIKSKIQPVEIDDFFDIYGPRGHARMMYPGDLNGGAENVANCRCWLHYTNIAPSNLKKKGTIQINPHVNLENENSTTFSANTETKGETTKSKGSTSTSSNENKVLFANIKNRINSYKAKIGNKIAKTNINESLRRIKIDLNSQSKKIFNTFKSEGEIDKNLKENWKVTDTDKLPSHVSTEIKELIKRFESHDEKIFDGNEWGKVYNITKDEFDPIMSDKSPDGVNPLKEKDYGDDELIVIHNHTSDSPFSIEDIGKLLESEEHVVKLIAITPKRICVVEPSIKGSIYEDIPQVSKELNKINAETIKVKNNFDSMDEFNQRIYDKIKSNKNINKYIESWEEYEK